jgi:glycosyltransferase involved in cell wall biosynthesis
MARASMPATPRVSIVMNVCDGEAFVRDALRSACAQTYGDWELICYDDRSTDGTAAAVQSCTDARVRYVLAPERVPLGAARAAALDLARGEWIAFLDQDDLWHEEKLAWQLEQIDIARGDVGLVYGRTVAFRADGTRRAYDARTARRPLLQGHIFPALVESACFIAMSSALVSRRALDAIGGVAAHLEVAVDYHLFLAVARRFPVHAVQETCCWYREHAGNMSQRLRMTSFREALALVESHAAHVDAAVLRRRRRVYHTLIALEELRMGERAAGLARLARRGSLPYLLSRPAARAARACRRRFQQGPGGSALPPPP